MHYGQWAFVVYAVASVLLAWSLINRLQSDVSLDGGPGARLTGTSVGRILGLVARVVLLLFTATGFAHQVGLMADPLSIVGQLLPGVAAHLRF